MNYSPRSILIALVWLAILGGVVLLAAKVVGKAAGRAEAAI